VVARRNRVRTAFARLRGIQQPAVHVVIDWRSADAHKRPSVQYDPSMRTALKCVLIATLLAVAVGQNAIAGGPEISAAERATLLKEARSLAASYGGSTPYDIEAVLTTTVKAQRLLSPGASMPACESSRSCATWPIYVVAMRGHFDCHSCSMPPGGKVGTSKFLTYVIPAKKPPPRIWSFASGQSAAYPNLKTIGSPVTLYRGHA